MKAIIQNPKQFFKGQVQGEKMLNYESVSPVKQEIQAENSHAQKIESIRNLISKTSALTSPTNK